MTQAVQIDIDDAPEQKPEGKVTTAQLQELLAQKYPRDRYALFFDVPDNVGTNQRRRADAIAIGCWNSVGHLIDGFELKVSRSDWLREVQSVTKADPFIERCDRWWLVTADTSIANLEEIPACWGWMAVTKGGLRVQRPAQRLPQPDNGAINRMFAIGLFRKMQGDLTSSPEVANILKEMRAKNEAEIEQRVRWATERNAKRATEAEERLAKFEKESGLKLDDWRLGNVGPLCKTIAEMSYGDGLQAVAKEFERQEKSLTELLEAVKAVRGHLPQFSSTSTGESK